MARLHVQFFRLGFIIRTELRVCQCRRGIGRRLQDAIPFLLLRLAWLPGLAGMIRFMEQFETGKGDYSKDRHQWLDEYTVDDIAKIARRKKGPENRQKEQKKHDLAE